MLKANESRVDRILRVIAGVVLVWAGLWPLGGLGGQTLGVVAAIVGLILFVTGLTGFCLIYRLLGVSTLKR